MRKRIFSPLPLHPTVQVNRRGVIELRSMVVRPLRTGSNCTLSLLSSTELNCSTKVPTLVGSIRGTNAGTSYESPGTKGRRACVRLTSQSSHCAVLPFGNLSCFSCSQPILLTTPISTSLVGTPITPKLCFFVRFDL